MTNAKATSYDVITQQDDNGDILLPIPPMLLEMLDWHEGDDIVFAVDEDGKFVLSKKE